MGSFSDAMRSAAATGGAPKPRRCANTQPRRAQLQSRAADHCGTRRVRPRRFANGNIEPYEFTDIDRTAAAGLALAGKTWGRPDDTLGLAGVINGISGVHQAYLNAGGLRHPDRRRHAAASGAEQIIEAYYQLPVSFFKLTLDYQFIVNPAYNSDRGPASVVARAHARAVLIVKLL